MGWELEDVEKPFVAQLQALGWTHIVGSLDNPAVTGHAWLDEERLSEAVAAITRLGTHKLIEVNDKATATGGGEVQKPVYTRTLGSSRGPVAPLQQPAQGGFGGG